jgi:peroxiredoxin
MIAHRTLRFLALAVVLGAVALPASARLRIALAPGDPAPRIRMRDIARDTMVRYDWAGQPLTVVNFWATWCVPCKEEMPALQGLFDRHREAGLSVLGLLFDPPTGDAQIVDFLQEQGIRYPALRVDHDSMSAWGGIGIFPTTFLVDREGKIVRRYVGTSPEQVRGLADDVEAYLAGRPLGSMVLREVDAAPVIDAP